MQRAVLDLEARPGGEVLVAADARVLASADRVGDDLAVDVDGERGVDRDHTPVAADHLGGVDDVDRQERDLVVAVEPVVEPLRAERERRDRDAVEDPLAVR